MGIFFSKRKVISRVTDHDKAILQLKIQRDNLKKYQKRIELSVESDRQLAKRLLSEGKKDRAKLLLRKRRYQEQLLEQADGQLENLEKLTQDLEFAQIELTVVEGLKIGNNALKKINETFDIQDIEKILEESREGIDKQNELNELISGALTDTDESAVEDELATILSESNDVPKLPEVPIQEPKTIVHNEKVVKVRTNQEDPIMIPA